MNIKMLSECIYLTSIGDCTWACPYDSSYDCCMNCPLPSRHDEYAECGFICNKSEERAEVYLAQYEDQRKEYGKSMPKNSEVMLYYIWDKEIMDYVEVSLHTYNRHDALKKYEVYVLKEGETIEDLRGSNRMPNWSQISREYGDGTTYRKKTLSDYDFQPPRKGSLNKWQPKTDSDCYETDWDTWAGETGKHIIEVDEEMFLGIVETYDTESEMFDLSANNNLYKIAKLLAEELSDEEELFEFLTILVAQRCTYLSAHASASSQQRLIWLTANETYHHGGICSEQSLVLQMIMKHIKYPSTIYRPFKNHVAVAVLANDGEFYKLDTTFKKVSVISDMRRVKGKETYGYVREGAITLDEVETGHNKAALFRRERGKRICARKNIDYNDTEAVLELEYSRAKESRKTKATKKKVTTSKAATEVKYIPTVYKTKKDDELIKKKGFSLEGKSFCVEAKEWVSKATGKKYIVTYDKEKNISTYIPEKEYVDEDEVEIEDKEIDKALKEIFEEPKKEKLITSELVTQKKWSKDFPPGIIREAVPGMESIHIIEFLRDEWKKMTKTPRHMEDISKKIKEAVFVK